MLIWVDSSYLMIVQGVLRAEVQHRVEAVIVLRVD